MRYFQNGGSTYGYDPASQAHLIAAAVAAGWTDVTGSWPPSPPPPTNPVTIASVSYLLRFSAEETAAIHTAALASPPTPASLALFNYLMLAAASPTITLDDPAVVAGHAALVAAGLLTQARSAAILAP